jgi:ComF family protein
MIIFSVGVYEANLRTILHDLKYSGLKPLAATLGAKLADTISRNIETLKIDLILPVPLHPSRLAQRGFNQAEEIARSVSGLLKIPLETEILYATRKTKHQARLPADRREANVRGAYAVDDDKGFLQGKTILLIDDVTTTGATLRENEKVLRDAYAKKVIGAVVASAI